MTEHSALCCTAIFNRSCASYGAWVFTGRTAKKHREQEMNPLDTIKGTLIAGLVLTIALAVVVSEHAGLNILVLVRWLHIAAGVAWIGLLYYFNFVQVPAMAQAAADKGGPGGAGISKYVAPRALLWFRWAALVTWLSGVAYLAHLGWLLGAFSFGAAGTPGPYHNAIGIGAWLGTIMLINVWMIIWPNQKRVLGLTPATDDEKAKARRRAFLASRTNTLLSLPMLLFMAGSAHGLPF
jgi:uncharacterized membrane protein